MTILRSDKKTKTSSARKPRKKTTAEGRAGILFLLPNLLGFGIFTAGPVIAAFVLAFSKYDLLSGYQGLAGLENFREMFSDPVFRKSFINTLYFTGATVPLSIVLGLAAALLANRKLRGIVVFRSIYLVPYILVTVAVALVWKWMYEPQGLVNAILKLVGVSGPSWLTDTNWAMPALILISVWKFFGYNMVIFLAGLQGIPRDLLEASSVDGASVWQRFTRITLPLLSPTTFFVIIISIINSFQVFDQAYVMTRGGPQNSTNTLVLDIYKVGFQDFDMGNASAIGVVLFAAVFIFTAAQFILQRRWVHY